MNKVILFAILVLLVCITFMSCTTLKPEKTWMDEILENHDPGDSWTSAEKVLVSVDNKLVYKDIIFIYCLKKGDWSEFNKASLGLKAFATKVFGENSINSSGIKSEVEITSNGEIYTLIKFPTGNFINR